MTRTLTILAAVATLAVSAQAASAGAATKRPALTHGYTLTNTMISGYALGARPTNRIIMRDGGVCDPIRHMGC